MKFEKSVIIGFAICHDAPIARIFLDSNDSMTTMTGLYQDLCAVLDKCFPGFIRTDAADDDIPIDPSLIIGKEVYWHCDKHFRSHIYPVNSDTAILVAHLQEQSCEP